MDGGNMKNIMNVVLVILVSTQLVSCGKKNGQSQIVSSNAVQSYSTEQSLNTVVNSIPCQRGGSKVLSVLHFASMRARSVGQIMQNIPFSSIGAKQVAFGTNSYGDVVAVKDYGTSMDVYLYMCPSAPYQNSGLQDTYAQTAELLAEPKFDANSSCNVNQVVFLPMNMVATAAGSFPVNFFPLSVLGSVGGVCPAAQNFY
jgi:hypothetical protein